MSCAWTCMFASHHQSDVLTLSQPRFLTSTRLVIRDKHSHHTCKFDMILCFKFSPFPKYFSRPCLCRNTSTFQEFSKIKNFPRLWEQHSFSTFYLTWFIKYLKAVIYVFLKFVSYPNAKQCLVYTVATNATEWNGIGMEWIGIIWNGMIYWSGGLAYRENSSMQGNWLEAVGWNLEQ